MPFPFLLLLARVLPQATPAAPAKDALTLLNEVSQRYADAKSYHLEAVEEKTESHELSRHWNKRLLTAIVMRTGATATKGILDSGQQPWSRMEPRIGITTPSTIFTPRSPPRPTTRRRARSLPPKR